MTKRSKYNNWCVCDTETLKEFKDISKFNYDSDVLNYENSSNYLGRRIFLLSFYSNKQKEVFEVYNNQKDIIELLCKYGLIYFHNLSYDGNFILKLLQKLNWKQRKELISTKNINWYDYMMIGSKIYKIEINYKNKTTLIIDSNNFIRQSVKDIPKFYGLENEKKTWQGKEYDEKWMYDYVLFHKTSNELAEFKEYCINDAKIVYLALLKLFDFCEKYGNGLEVKKYTTISSFAYDLFKSMNEYNNNYLNLKTSNFLNKDDYYLIRSLYKGGFCDVNDDYKFKEWTNKDDVNSYDINSAYPAILKNNAVPVSFNEEDGLEFVDNIIIFNVVDTITAKTNLRFLFNDCFKLRLDLNSHPKSFDKGSIFCLFEEEFNWMRKYYSGEIFIVKKIPTYGLKLDKYGYVDKFYNLKKQFKIDKNKGFETLSKLFINSVTGKFGQKPSYKNRVYFNNENDAVIYQTDPELVKVGNYKRIEKEVKLNDSNDESFYIAKKYFDEETINLDIQYEINNFLIVSYITMKTRSKIIYFIDKIGVNNWIYSDTDSIKIKGHLQDEIVGLELGQFKNEGKADIAMFYHPKAYFWNGEFTFAGVSKDKTRSIDYKAIKDGYIIISGKKNPVGVIDGIELKDINYIVGE